MNHTFPLLLLLALAILLPRVFDLDAFQTADEKMWVANTRGFVKNLATGRLDKLLGQAHPGITTQWLGAIAISSSSPGVRKLPLAVGQSIIIGLISYVFFKLWGRQPAISLTLLLALNPFLVAHTRVYAMDSLLAIFLLLSVGCLLLWQKNKTPRYLAFSAIAGALAVLSKLPGLLIVPFSLFIIFRPRPAAVWLVVFIITLLFVFPSLLLDPPAVARQLIELFPAENARLGHHVENNYTYYLESLIFFSTPLHLVTLAALIIIFIINISGRRHRGEVSGPGNIKDRGGEQTTILLLFAVLFIIQMTLGAKKGDRYILPSFLFLDTLVVATFSSFIRRFRPRRPLLLAAYCILLIAISWQAIDIARLHPHTLSYVNPITKPFYGGRRLGWGEGFDLAAEYLNQKPSTEQLIVASIYPTEFAYNFNGQVIPLNHYDGNNADYVVLYRAMLERGPDAWETDLLNQFANQIPEKIITLNGLEYLWIYKK